MISNLYIGVTCIPKNERQKVLHVCMIGDILLLPYTLIHRFILIIFYRELDVAIIV